MAPSDEPSPAPPGARTDGSLDAAADLGGRAVIPLPAVRRLSLYLRQLESFVEAGRDTISSRDLGQALGMGDAQIRKDLANFGTFGQPGVGYHTGQLADQLRAILGTDRTWDVVLVGAGNIGRALTAYRRFADKGFRLRGVFDRNAELHGRELGEEKLQVQPTAELGAFVREHGVRLAVLAVPASAAQAAADLLVGAGVRGILNFAPVRLQVPETVFVNDVDLAAQLEQLAFQVNLGEEESRQASSAG
ncbi:MAG: redox-sensing transcriptional repressor Rex [Planctomycetota bacterium]